MKEEKRRRVPKLSLVSRGLQKSARVTGGTEVTVGHVQDRLFEDKDNPRYPQETDKETLIFSGCMTLPIGKL